MNHKKQPVKTESAFFNDDISPLRGVVNSHMFPEAFYDLLPYKNIFTVIIYNGILFCYGLSYFSPTWIMKNNWQESTVWLNRNAQHSQRRVKETRENIGNQQKKWWNLDKTYKPGTRVQ